MILVSAGVHGLVLGLPLPAPKSTETPDISLAASPAASTVDVVIVPQADLVVPPAGTTPATPTNTAATPAKAAAPELPSPGEMPPETVPPTLPAPTEPIEPTEATEPTEPTEPVTPEPQPPSIEDLPVENGTANNTSVGVPPTLEQQLQDVAAYAFNGQKVLKDGDIGPQLLGWTAEGQVFPTKASPLVVPYLLGDRCLPTPPASGVLVVVLAVDDTPLKGPEIISSTGYTILDEKAQAMIQAGEYTFPERERTEAYSLAVQVAYPPACL